MTAFRLAGERPRVIGPVTGKVIVTYESIRSGQPRAYADSEYEGYLVFSVPEGQMWASKWMHNEEMREVVKPYVRLFCHDFAAEKGGKREWHEPWLEELRMVEPGRWYVLVKSPYLD